MRRRFIHRDSQISTIEPLVLMSATTINGTDGADWIAGDDNDNTILAGGGDDEIYAPIGSNVIVGGSGRDVLVVYEGVRSEFTVESLADGSVLLSGPGLNGDDVNNILRNVEAIQFNDGAVQLNTAGDPVAPSPTFGNTPDDSSPEQGNPGGLIRGTNASEWISGTDRDDDIHALGGNDEIYAPVGNNNIDGGDGFDTLIVYEGRLSDYSINDEGAAGIRLTGAGLNGQTVSNLLTNIERIQFNDQSLDLLSQPVASNLPEPSAGVSPPFPVGSDPSIETPVVADSIPPQTVEPDPPPFSNPDPSIDLLTRVVELTNDIRIQNGLNALSVNFELQAAAQTHSNNLAQLDFFSHTGLDGTLPWDRAMNAGYDYQTIGENIAAGQTTPEQVVSEWFDSPGHRANILNPNFQEIGIGYEFLANDTGVINYNHYWTQLFGTER